MKIYIAGRVTGLPYDNVKAKFKAAEEAMLARDWTPVNPLNHVNSRASPEEAMRILLPLLLDCKAILLLNDSKYSEGAQIEAMLARYCHKIILNEEDFD